MAGAIKDLLKKAYAEKGIDLPAAQVKKKKKERKPEAPKKDALKSLSTSDSVASTPVKKDAPQDLIQYWQEKHLAKARMQPTSSKPARPRLNVSCYGDGKTSKPITAPAQPIKLRIHSNAKLDLDQEDHEESLLLESFAALGAKTQCGNTDNAIDERQIVLGLDFGTSSVKVVVGDPALGKAFAVPFRCSSDITRYLLPTRLHESSGAFSLNSGEIVHRDLKLSLIANPDDPALRRRVIAFLALVIRHVRGWLLTEQRDIYQRTRLLWKVAIGLPVAHHLDDELHRAFQDITHTAWLASIARSVNVRAMRNAEKRQSTLKGNPESASLDEDIEVNVVPEIAAQIYGFVNSSRFNRRDPNIYLMVDIGAGSVDSSLFHVKPSRGKWDFEFFTSAVEPHGVINLHRHRVRWWEEQLAKHSANQKLTTSLVEVKFATDQIAALPECFSRYFSGVTVVAGEEKDNPDQQFFRYKVVQQVRGRTYWRAWNDGLLTQAQLVSVPTFYCGGGMRMKYYTRLQKEMQSMPGCSWLNAKPRRVELPKNLEAPGLKRADYDRLTVAYGLSFLEVGSVTKSLPAPKLPTDPQSDWRSNYTGKDCC